MRRYLIVTAILSVILASCSMPKKSALSEVEITDPHLIKPEITMKRSLLAGGTASQSILVSLKDGNNDYIELKNGSISCGPYRLVVDHSYFGNTPRYKIPDNQLTINFNTKYTFTVNLPNGQSHLAEVKTPRSDFLGFRLPRVAGRTESILLEWNGLRREAHLELAFTKTYLKGQTRVTKSGTIRIADPHAGEHSLTSEFFTLPEHIIQEARFTLRSTDYGKLDPSFRGGGFIKMICEVEKAVLFKD